MEMGTFHLPLYRLNHELLELLAFNSPLNGVQGGDQESHYSVLWEKLAGQAFSYLFPGEDIMSPNFASSHT